MIDLDKEYESLKDSLTSKDYFLTNHEKINSPHRQNAWLKTRLRSLFSRTTNDSEVERVNIMVESLIREIDDKPNTQNWQKILSEVIAEFSLLPKREKNRLAQQNEKEEIMAHSVVKIKWNGQKNQLYDVIRQLKEQEKILNSYTDLAVFLKTNFEMFANTSLSTIETELHRGRRPPKNRRINLESPDNPE